MLATSEGTPLFVGELVRMPVDVGTLKKDGERWTTAVDLATLDIPPTMSRRDAALVNPHRSGIASAWIVAYA